MSIFLLAVVVLVSGVLTSAEVPPQSGDDTCQSLTPKNFELFVAENKVAMFQVHDGAEILAAEIPEALKRLGTPIGYATLDGSANQNKELVAKLDRSKTSGPDFFVFHNGVPHSTLKRLRAGMSVDDVEEVLVFLSLQESALEDTQTDAKMDFPLWSVHSTRDSFEEVLTTVAFDEMMASAPPNQITVVQFFSRQCKYCQLLSFEWHKVSKEMAQQLGLVFIRVDGTSADTADLLERHSVKGFPSIKFFVGPSYESTYSGDRIASAIKDEISKLMESGAKRRRNADGSFNMQKNLPDLLKNLERQYSAGKLSEKQYLARFKMMQSANSVTE